MSLADFQTENLGYRAQSQEIAGAVSGLNFGEQSGIVVIGNVPQRSEDNGYKISGIKNFDRLQRTLSCIQK